MATPTPATTNTATNQLDDKMIRLEAIASRLNQAANEATATIQYVESILNRLCLGIEADSGSYRLETKRIKGDQYGPLVNQLEVTHYLAYGRVRGEFRIHVLRETMSQDEDEHDLGLVKEETVDWACLSRRDVLESTAKLPELLDAICDQAEELAGKSEVTIETVRSLAAMLASSTISDPSWDWGFLDDWFRECIAIDPDAVTPYRDMLDTLWRYRESRGFGPADDTEYAMMAVGYYLAGKGYKSWTPKHQSGVVWKGIRLKKSSNTTPDAATASTIGSLAGDRRGSSWNGIGVIVKGGPRLTVDTPLVVDLDATGDNIVIAPADSAPDEAWTLRSLANDLMPTRVDAANSLHDGKGEQVSGVGESAFGPVS